jgi:hypothetical protein
MADLQKVLDRIDQEIVYMQAVEQSAIDDQAILLSLKTKLSNNPSLLDEVIAFIKIIRKRSLIDGV